jgi:hypothetical protein
MEAASPRYHNQSPPEPKIQRNDLGTGAVIGGGNYYSSFINKRDLDWTNSPLTCKIFAACEINSKRPHKTADQSSKNQ